MLLERVKLESKWEYFSIMFVFGVLFYAINALTPLFSDDWHYGFIWGTSEHISSIQDVLVSQYSHYFGNNGRFVPHLLLQTFDGLLGKSAFNLANALVFVIMIHLLNVNFVKEKKHYVKTAIISAFAILVVMCGFRNAFLWMSGAFNYIWGFSFLLVFNYLFSIKIANKYLYSLLFVLGILCGWTNEAYVAGYCCYILYMVYDNRKNMQPHQWLLLAGLLLGAALLCLSPGSIHRSGIAETQFSLVSFIWKLGLNFSQMFNLRLFFIAVLFLIFKKESRSPWIVAMLSSFVFVMLTGHASEHSRFGIEMFALIIILSSLSIERIGSWVYLSLSAISLICLVAAFPYCLDNYRIFKDMEKNVAMTKDGVIPLDVVKNTPSFLDRFVVHFDNYQKRTGFDKADWINTNVTRYYHSDIPLVFIQKELLDDIKAGKDMSDFDYASDYFYYVREWDEQDSIRSVEFILSPSKWQNYPILNRMERFASQQLSASHYGIVEFNNKSYLIVAKNSTIDDRVIRIEVE